VTAIALRWCGGVGVVSRGLSPLNRAQVCTSANPDKSVKPALRAVLTAADAWARRRVAALACYSGVWEE